MRYSFHGGKLDRVINKRFWGPFNEACGDVCDLDSGGYVVKSFVVAWGRRERFNQLQTQLLLVHSAIMRLRVHESIKHNLINLQLNGPDFVHVHRHLTTPTQAFLFVDSQFVAQTFILWDHPTRINIIVRDSCHEAIDTLG